MTLLLTICAAVSLIVQCRSIWIHLTAYGMWVNRGVSLILAAVLIILSVFDADGRWNPKISKDTVKTAIIIILYCLLFVLVNPVHYKRVLRCGLILAVIIIFVRSPGGAKKGKNILTAFKYAMAVVAAVSIICWVCLSLLHMIDYPWSGDVYVDWSDNGMSIRRSHFIYIYYETQWFITGYVARNSAIFTEGPMANYCFSIALIIDLFIQDDGGLRLKRITRFLLIAAVVTTFTATGFIVLVIISIDAIIRRDKSRRISNRTGFEYSYLLVFIIGIIAGAVIYNKIKTESASIRIDDIKAGIHAWIDFPVFGVGFENNAYVARYASPWRLNNIGYSSSIMGVLTDGGIYLFAPYAAALFRIIIKAVSDKLHSQTVFSFIFVYLFAVTIIPYQYITMLIFVLLINGRLPFKA